MSISGIMYLIASVCFILALQGLNSFSSSKRGLFFGIVGLALSVITTILLPEVDDFLLIALAIGVGAFVGVYIALEIDMTKLPELMAAFHSLVGLAAVFIAIASTYHDIQLNIQDVSKFIELSIGAIIGAITFSGSLIAFLKLSGKLKGNFLAFSGLNIINLLLFLSIIITTVIFCINFDIRLFWLITGLSFILGFLLIIPIGGADMPVVVSMLNSYSGWAASGIGFSISNPALIIVGALVGSSGAILSYIMCKSMNRSIFNVIWGSFSSEEKGTNQTTVSKSYKAGNGDDAAFILSNASKVIIVPGYGMAVAQAQYVLKEMADKLKALDIDVKYAIHPVAGRMPGHMNVLLAEAKIDYEEVFELEQINPEFSTADVVYVIGANDVTNPSARTDVNSPIYGMPILDVEKAKTVLFVKRSMGVGYSGVDNELFYNNDTMMLLGDAKTITEEIVQALDK